MEKEKNEIQPVPPLQGTTESNSAEKILTQKEDVVNEQESHPMLQKETTNIENTEEDIDNQNFAGKTNSDLSIKKE